MREVPAPAEKTPPRVRVGNRVTALALLLLATPTLAIRSEIVPGGIAILETPDRDTCSAARFESRAPLCIADGDKWLALVAIPLRRAPGPARLTFAGGRSQAFEVEPKQFGESWIDIADSRQVTPTGDDLKRIIAEQKIFDRSRATFVPGPVVTRYQLPVTGVISTLFGVSRFVNGNPRSRHRGLDIAAPEGTEIRAPGGAQVLAVGDLFFTGNTVFLHHGQGLVSLYAHLSQVHVEAGQLLAAGQIFGRVGSTGRTTGPHLHWGVTLSGVAIDPLLLLDSPIEPPVPEQSALSP